MVHRGPLVKRVGIQLEEIETEKVRLSYRVFLCAATIGGPVEWMDEWAQGCAAGS
jgi:hypothetical protein